MPIRQHYAAEDAGEQNYSDRPFIDRDEHIRAFVDAIEKQDLDERRVLVYHGIGGIGKTRLANELGRVLDGNSEKAEEIDRIAELAPPPRLCWAKIDFEETRRRKPATGLYHLRTRLLAKYGFQFPTFDLAFIEYWSKAYPETDPPRPDPSVLGEHGDLLITCVDALEEVPLAGLMTKIPKHLDRLGQAAVAWYRKRNEEALQGVPGLPAHKIEKRLSGLWTYDFTNSDIGKDYQHSVLFADSYEALREDRRDENKRHQADWWLREWIAGLPGTLVVVTGHNRLYWSEVDEDWEAVLQQCHVRDLSPSDARSFLERSGIEEKAIRDCIVETTSGVPYDLDLAVDLYEEIVGRGEEPIPEDFGETPYELSECFFRYLKDGEKAMLELLALPRTFNVEIVEALIGEFDPGFSTGQFIRLRRFAFVNQAGEEREEETYSLHERAREALQKHAWFFTEPEAIHGFLFKHYAAKVEDLEPGEIELHHERSLQEAFHHGQQSLNVENFGEWFFEKEPVFDQAARWQMLVALHRRLLNLQETAFGEENPQLARTLNNLAGIYREQGRYEEAESLYNRALKIRKSTLGEEHPLVAETLNNLGLLHQRRGEREEAESLYTRALKIEESAFEEEHPQLAETLNHLGLLYWRRGKHEKAESLYNRALKIRKSTLGEEHPLVAETLNNLGILHQRQGEYEDAKSLYTQTLEIEESTLGKEHPRVATTLNNLGLLRQRQGEYEEAESLYNRALKIRKSTFGEEHPRVATTLDNLGLLRQRQGEYEEAESLYNRALEIEESILGKEHPRVATTLHKLAGLYQDQEKYEKAESLYNRALKIRKSSLGEEHPRVAETLNNLGLLYSVQERQGEGRSLIERALTIARQGLGRSHPKTQEITATLKTFRSGEEE